MDEIGYLPVTRSGAILFFQLVNRRYEHASTLVTSNKGFEQWGEILHDEVMAAALLDRLLPRRLRGARRERGSRVMMGVRTPSGAPAPVATLPPRRLPKSVPWPEVCIFWWPLTSDGHRERWSLPLATVREAIVNAVVHADYSRGSAEPGRDYSTDRLDLDNPELPCFALTLAPTRLAFRRRQRILGHQDSEKLIGNSDGPPGREAPP